MRIAYSSRPNWSPPPPPITRLRERGWRGPNSDEGTDTVVYVFFGPTLKDVDSLCCSASTIQQS
jgi:hypothetical protein